MGRGPPAGVVRWVRGTFGGPVSRQGARGQMFDTGVLLGSVRGPVLGVVREIARTPAVEETPRSMQYMASAAQGVLVSRYATGAPATVRPEVALSRLLFAPVRWSDSHKTSASRITEAVNPPSVPFKRPATSHLQHLSRPSGPDSQTKSAGQYASPASQAVKRSETPCAATSGGPGSI